MIWKWNKCQITDPKLKLTNILILKEHYSFTAILLPIPVYVLVEKTITLQGVCLFLFFLLYVTYLLLHYSWDCLTATTAQALALLVMRFVLSFIKVVKYRELFVKTKTKFFFISRPRQDHFSCPRGDTIHPCQFCYIIVNSQRCFALLLIYYFLVFYLWSPYGIGQTIYIFILFLSFFLSSSSSFFFFLA